MGQTRGGPKRPGYRGIDRRRRSNADTGQSVVDFGILLGQLTALVGFVGLVFFTLVEFIVGSYFGANPGFGMSVALAVLVLGVAVAAVLWVGRLVTVTAEGLVRSLRDR